MFVCWILIVLRISVVYCWLWMFWLVLVTVYKQFTVDFVGCVVIGILKDAYNIFF